MKKTRLSTLLSRLGWKGEKVILQLCADTGSDTWPYRGDPEYFVVTIGIDIGVENLIIDAPVHGIIANPVCTEFSPLKHTSTVQQRKRDPDHELGMVLVDECIRIIEACDETLAWYVIENPSGGALRRYMGDPDYSYEPWWYGSPWTKRTALWGDFQVPERVYHDWDDVPERLPLYVRPYHTRSQPKPGLSWQHKSAWELIPEFRDSGMPRPDSDMEFRSLCSQRFAQAFKLANP